jgi:hypothetical protein
MVLNWDAEPRTATSYAVCGNGIGAHQVVEGPWTRLPDGGFGSAAATCPAGKMPLGGGVESSGITTTVTDSYPSGVSWVVCARSDGRGDQIQANVVCGT